MIAPTIHGLDDIKKAIAIQLFSGSKIDCSDQTRRRSDIHILLLGDPGTGKSQLLTSVGLIAPKCIYTSGKGASAAGLTGAVIFDSRSKSYCIVGGAMPLADDGIICIDEFDKMTEQDRGAIHQGMEQQIISIAKAGISTHLNSRCAVLAAANPKKGRWDDKKSFHKNVNLMPPILSRFDMIFVIKDKQNSEDDSIRSKHMVRVHKDINNENEKSTYQKEVCFLKKYIAYCRKECDPRLSEDCRKSIIQEYIEMRTLYSKESQMTVRQLEGLLRSTEALAKMRLRLETNIDDFHEALRLFQVSTVAGKDLDANNNLDVVD